MKLTRIVIFAKAPAVGFAKTRLSPVLGEEGAARLARAMLEETWRVALEADFGPVELCVTPEPKAPEWRGTPLPSDVDIAVQGDGDLGARLERAARRVLSSGENILLIGTDCVEMSADLLRAAAAALADHDAIIHPTQDGGYALLGLARHDPAVFEQIAWSTDSVAQTTIARLKVLNWHVKTAAILHDIDRPEDLARLPETWRQRLAENAPASARRVLLPET